MVNILKFGVFHFTSLTLKFFLGLYVTLVVSSSKQGLEYPIKQCTLLNVSFNVVGVFHSSHGGGGKVFSQFKKLSLCGVLFISHLQSCFKRVEYS